MTDAPGHARLGKHTFENLTFLLRGSKHPEKDRSPEDSGGRPARITMLASAKTFIWWNGALQNAPS
jgi:hypothetical protein